MQISFAKNRLEPAYGLYFVGSQDQTLALHLFLCDFIPFHGNPEIDNEPAISFRYNKHSDSAYTAGSWRLRFFGFIADWIP